MTTRSTDLEAIIAEAAGDKESIARPEVRLAVEETIARLDRGEIGLAEKRDGEWAVNAWIQQAIGLYFRLYPMEELVAGPLVFHDRLPLKKDHAARGVRVVPGAIARYGSFIEPGAVLMPSFVNIGAHVGSGTIVDTWATVGSGAWIGRNVHLSGGVGIGGVLEPVGALPVIVEDDVLIGGNCGVYEGTIVKRRAVLASGTVITASTPIYDLPNDQIIEPEAGAPLIVPEGAVVVPGSRPVTSGRGREWGLSVATPIIVKYRDERTSARTALESWIR